MPPSCQLPLPFRVGVIDGGNTTFTPIASRDSLSYISENSVTATINFTNLISNSVQTLNSALVANAGTVNFNGGNWNFTNYCDAYNKNINDSIMLNGSGSQTPTLNLDPNGGTSVIVTAVRNLEVFQGNVVVYTTAYLQLSSNIFHTGTLTFKDKVTLFTYTDIFAPNVGDNFAIYDLIDSKGNYSMIYAGGSNYIQFGNGTSLIVTQTDPQNPLPANTIWVLFEAFTGGIRGNIPAANISLPNGCSWQIVNSQGEITH